jgi:hypothetical protein
VNLNEPENKGINMHPATILSLQSDVGVILTDIQVSKWTDQSGCGNDAVSFVENSGPIVVNDGLNNKPVLQFQGPLKVPLTSSPGYTVFALVCPISAKTEGDVFFSNGNAQGTRWALGTGQASDYGAGWGGAGDKNLGNSDFIAVGTFKLLTYVKNSLGWAIYCNGEFIRFISDASILSYFGDHFWVIGRESIGGDSYYFQGRMAALRVLEEALNNGQRKKIEKEIMAYWGL